MSGVTSEETGFVLINTTHCVSLFVLFMGSKQDFIVTFIACTYSEIIK